MVCQVIHFRQDWVVATKARQECFGELFVATHSMPALLQSLSIIFVFFADLFPGGMNTRACR